MPDRGRRNPTADELDASSDDPAYKFVAPEEGTYRLLVRDQFGDGRYQREIHANDRCCRQRIRHGAKLKVSEAV